MPSCVKLELVIFIVPFIRLKGFHNASTSILKKTFKLIHKHTELEQKPIRGFQYVLFVTCPLPQNSGNCFGCILGLFSNKYSSGQITIL